MGVGAWELGVGELDGFWKVGAPLLELVVELCIDGGERDGS